MEKQKKNGFEMGDYISEFKVENVQVSGKTTGESDDVVFKITEKY